MPRNVTVTFADGSQHVYQGIPDNVTPDAVTARAQQEFGLNVKALDGGRGGKPAVAPKSVTPAPQRGKPGENVISQSQAKAVWDKASARLESRIAKLPEAAKRKAREAFAADPAIQRLRQNISGGKRLSDPLVQQRMKQNSSDRAGQQVKESGNFLTALSGGVKRGAFGIPEHIAAAATRFLPSAITGNTSDASYDEILAQVRSDTDAELDKSLAGNILGQIAGGWGALKGAGLAYDAVKGTHLGGQAVRAAVASPVGKTVAAAAKAAPKTAKVAALAAGGAAGGGAQALGEGSDVSTGATIGAVGGPALVGTVKGLGLAGKFLLRPVADVLGHTKADAILRRFTSASPEEIRKSADAYRKKTGAEPTLFELLPLADRNQLSQQILRRSPQASEATAAAVRKRVGNIGPEMQTTARKATDAEKGAIVESMAKDLEKARGVPNAPGTPDSLDMDSMAVRAGNSPLDLEALRRTEAAARMGPVDEQIVADDLEAMFPKTLENGKDGEVKEVFSDPEVNSLLRRVAGALKLRKNPEDETAAVSGLTVRDVTSLVDKLGDIHPASPDYLNAQRAIHTVLDHMAESNPEARRLTDEMREQFAARSRMMEGMAEGGRTRTRESVPVGDRSAGQEMGNAYDTPEGAAGRLLGQSNALQRQLSGTMQDTLRTTGDIAESGQVQAALRGNLGDDAARRITGAAEAQMDSARRLASVGRETSQEAETIGAEDIGRMVLALNPAAMPTTKLFAISRLMRLARLPEKRATQLVDMLFSQDPKITNRAIGLLNRAGNPGRSALQAIGRGLMVGSMAERALGDDGQAPAVVPDASGAEMPVDDGGNPVEEDQPQEFGSYDEMLADWEANEDPELVDLIDRQSGQESGGQQFDENGDPLESSAGAIGVMQVMPGTAPEAAELAGLPWDEEAYYTDPAYNKLIGIAYMKEMLRRYDGDVELALAAYNAGPGAVDRAGGVPNIEETRNYVANILR